jgi:hypothetical protein
MKEDESIENTPLLTSRFIILENTGNGNAKG